MEVTFRPYQTEAIDSSFKEWVNHRSILLELPTGTGKTVIFSGVIKRWLEVFPFNRILVLAHRYELLEQARDKLETFSGIHAGMEKAAITANPQDQVVVGSVQSMQSQKRMEKYDADSFDLVIVDEAHHSTANSYRKLIDHFSKAKILGVTATPDRSDKSNLGSVFEKTAYRYELGQAIKDGYLSPIVCTQIPLQIDLQGVKTKAGDYEDRSLDKAIRPYFKSIIESMKKECADRKTVVFLPLVQTAIDFAELLNEAGFKACSVSGKTPPEERKQLLEDFERGEYNVICNAMLLTEGWDCPSVDCIVPLRPTKSRSLFTQIVGRGCRLSPGKENLLLLDYLWLTNRVHKLTKKTRLRRLKDLFIQQDDFTGCTKEEVEKIVDDALPPNMQEEREMVLSQILAENSIHERVTFNPLESSHEKPSDPYHYFWMINRNVREVTGDFENPEPQQLERLKKMGLQVDSHMTKKIADKILRVDYERYRKGLTTYKQVKLLRQKGFVDTEKWNRQDASKLIGMIADNKWRIPKNIDPKTFTPDQLQPKRPNNTQFNFSAFGPVSMRRG